MSLDSHSSAVQTARDYYNNEDADNFYHSIWGGEDIHVGIYRSDEDSIFDASRRTITRMASLLRGVDESMRVLDIGSGYCGAARFLARSCGCQVVGLNLSEVENERARELNAKHGLDDRIEVVTGSFENIPYPDSSFDVVWSQDAILHSGNRAGVLAEVARVLKGGGQFVFTDPMQADDCPEAVLQPILDRIHLSTLGSPGFYRHAATRVGLAEDAYHELTPHLVTHYSTVLKSTEEKMDELSKTVSPEYLDRMTKGLRHWIDGGEQGHLAWGIFLFRKVVA